MAEYLVVECGGTLRAFRSVACAPNMPTADFDALLSRVLERMHWEHQARQQLFELVREISDGEGLYEHSELSPHERGALYRAAFDFVRYLLAYLTQIKAYRDGVLPYAYQGLIDHDTIILVATGSGPA